MTTMGINLNPPPQYRDITQVRANRAMPGDLIEIDGKESVIQKVTQIRTEKGENCVITWTRSGYTGDTSFTPDANIITRQRRPEPAKFAVLRKVNEGVFDKDLAAMFEALDAGLEDTWIPQEYRDTLIRRAKMATNGRILDLALAYVDLVELFTEGFRAVEFARPQDR